MDTQAIQYYNVVAGCITTRCSEGDPGAIKRLIKGEDGINKETWEQHHFHITGTVTAVKVYNERHGKKYVVHLYSPQHGHQALQLWANSPYGDSFARRITAADLSKPIRITAFSFVPQGSTNNRKVEGLNLYQGDFDLPKDNWRKLPNCYTKEQPNGIPQPPKQVGMTPDDWKVHFAKVTDFLSGVVHDVGVFLERNT